MVNEPLEPIENGPIERYLVGVQRRLETRYESDAVDGVLAEFHSHLTESADDILKLGVQPVEAEILALERFGQRDAEALALRMVAKRGLGDKFWGRLGATWGVLSVAALCLYSHAASGPRPDRTDALSVWFLVSLLIFAYACLKARNIAVFRYTAALGSIVLAASALMPGTLGEPSIADINGVSVVSMPAVRYAYASPLAADSVGVLVASSDQGALQSLFDALERDQALSEANDASTTENKSRGSASSRLADNPFGEGGATSIYGNRPLSSLSLLVEAIPLHSRLGAVWLALAFLVRAMCSWITRLGSWNPVRPSLWIA